MLFAPFILATVENDKKKVLIIEDNIETQLIFKVYLRDKYNVEVVDNGEKGIEFLSSKPYDILLLDINLPGKLNGEDVLKETRNALNLKNFPIIVITAYALKGDKERFLNLGANNYLSKPVEKLVLLEEIQKCLPV